MPKQAKSSTAKVRQICQEYPDEFSATPVCDLRYNLCDVLVKCDKTFFVESHRKSKQHQRKLETKSKSQSKQTFLQLDQVNFKEQVVSSFLAADIPLQKLDHPSLKSLFATMGKVLPSDRAANSVDFCIEFKFEFSMFCEFEFDIFIFASSSSSSSSVKIYQVLFEFRK